MNTSVIRLFAISLSLFGLAACHDFGHQRYHVDGAATDFCVPDSNTVEDVWYAPKTKYDASAFAFQGCYGIETGGTPCPPDFLDGGVDGGTVEQLSRRQSNEWAFYKHGALTKYLINGDHAVITTKYKNRVIVYTKPTSIKSPVFLFVIDSKLPKFTHIDVSFTSISDDDTVETACFGTSSEHIKTEKLSCDRFAAGKDFSIDYGFSVTLDQLKDIDFNDYDKSALSMVNGWRCKKRS